MQDFSFTMRLGFMTILCLLCTLIKNGLQFAARSSSSGKKYKLSSAQHVVQNESNWCGVSGYLLHPRSIFIIGVYFVLFFSIEKKSSCGEIVTYFPQLFKESNLLTIVSGDSLPISTTVTSSKQGKASCRFFTV